MKRPVVREDILDYVTYEEQREAIRASALKAKAPRRIHLGPNLTFLFENTETIRYQILEMVRAERTVKEADIRHEIETYNELLGDAQTLGCTLLIEIENAAERDQKLTAWTRLPEFLVLETLDGKEIPALYDARQVGDRRLSSVQYLHFPIGTAEARAIRCDLADYKHRVELSAEQRHALRSDVGTGDASPARTPV